MTIGHPSRRRRLAVLLLLAGLGVGLYWGTRGPEVLAVPGARALLAVPGPEGMWGVMDADGAWVVAPREGELELRRPQGLVDNCSADVSLLRVTLPVEDARATLVSNTVAGRRNESQLVIYHHRESRWAFHRDFPFLSRVERDAITIYGSDGLELMRADSVADDLVRRGGMSYQITADEIRRVPTLPVGEGEKRVFTANGGSMIGKPDPAVLGSRSWGQPLVIPGMPTWSVYLPDGTPLGQSRILVGCSVPAAMWIWAEAATEADDGGPYRLIGRDGEPVLPGGYARPQPLNARVSAIAQLGGKRWLYHGASGRQVAVAGIDDDVRILELRWPGEEQDRIVVATTDAIRVYDQALTLIWERAELQVDVAAFVARGNEQVAFFALGREAETRYQTLLIDWDGRSRAVDGVVAAIDGDLAVVRPAPRPGALIWLEQQQLTRLSDGVPVGPVCWRIRPLRGHGPARFWLAQTLGPIKDEAFPSSFDGKPRKEVETRSSVLNSAGESIMKPVVGEIAIAALDPEMLGWDETILLLERTYGPNQSEGIYWSDGAFFLPVERGWNAPRNTPLTTPMQAYSGQIGKGVTVEYRFVDLKGRRWLPERYSRYRPMGGGVHLVVLADDQSWGYLGPNGEMIWRSLPEQADRVPTISIRVNGRQPPVIRGVIDVRR